MWSVPVTSAFLVVVLPVIIAAEALAIHGAEGGNVWVEAEEEAIVDDL